MINKYTVVVFIALLLIESIQIYSDLKEYEETIYNQKKSYLNVIKSDTKQISDLIYENVINIPEVISVFKNANNKVKKDVARKNLYLLLNHKYNTFTKYGIQQLHFHLPNNESFLRFHKPSKYGDNLTNIRASVKYVNEYKKSTFGFEEGKIFNGYRFVYPLFDSNKIHIGSVEISQSLLSFKKNYEKNNQSHIDFILKRDVVEKKVFKDELKNYVNYVNSNKFLIQKILYENNLNNKHLHLRDKFLQDIFNDKKLMHSIDNVEKISIVKFDNFKVYNVLFIPLLNDFNNIKIGYSIIISKSLFQRAYAISHIINIFAIFLLSIFIGILFAKKEKLKIYHEKSSNDYQLMTDLNSSLIIAIENNSLKSTNKKLKEFLHIENDDEDTIKRIFTNSIIQKDNYLYLNNSQTIFEDIYNSRHKEIVLQNNIGIQFIFEISSHSANFHSNKDYIIELTDITEFKKETLALENKAYTDKLTNIYNRLYFDNVFYRECKYMRDNKTNLSLIMFDIDYFKKINDDYGHEVGDLSLIFLATLVKNHIREDDIFCRWGGEEFMIIAHNNLNNTVDMAEHLRKVINKGTKQDEYIPSFSCSFGVISLKNMKSQKEALQKVDKLLYQAKDSGRNIVVSEIKVQNS